MTQNLQKDDIALLASLVRMDIRKKRRSLERFGVKPGQAIEEANKARATIEKAITFREVVLARLREPSRCALCGRVTNGDHDCPVTGEVAHGSQDG
ncbi:MAG: hypothetical protein Q8R28_15070 [Dehalococcoidia bacterium]|nr:hypothetical protein [Dehalococcoidia bacterium]